jgi:DNA primase
MQGLKIKQLLEQSGIATKQTKRSIVCSCPLQTCQSEFKVYIEKSSGRSICFKCGTKWKPQAILALMLQIPFEEAQRTLFGDINYELNDKLELFFNDEEGFDSIDAEFEEDAPVELLKEVSIDPLFMPVEASEEGMQYLAGRGVTDLNLIRQHGLLYSATMNAVIFVIRDLQSRIVGWQARYINPRDPKIRMMTYAGMLKAKILYNYNNTVNKHSLILTEGPFDCIKSDVVPGFTAVASLGKIISDDQINLLISSQAENIYLGLDKDAYTEVQKLAEKLASVKKFKLFRLIPPSHRKDLGECNEIEIQQALKSSVQLSGEKTSHLEVFLKD